jgi:hypothetical protein
MSDMFFAISIDKERQEYMIFTVEDRQYQFARLPQSYLNSLVIAHSIVSSKIKQIMTP